MRLRNFAFRFFAFLSLGPFLLSGCSTDLDPNADYKEIMVIYGILNPADTVHYVKVNKAFLNTNADARDIAANIPDSVTYRADELQVKLERLRSDSSVLASYPLERFISTNKDTGTFYNPDQVMFRTLPGQPGPLDENSIYRVSATNLKSGLTASGATALVKRNDASFPRRFSVFQISKNSSVDPSLDQQAVVNYDPQEKIQRIRFRAAENASIYNIKLTFNYTETDGTTTENKQVTWYIRQNFLDASKEINFGLEENSFYNNLLNLIDTNQDKSTTVRKAGDIFVTITAGSESMAINYRVNNSFSIFAQVKPEWDNIKNGIGLVGSRAQRTVKARLTQPALLMLIQDSRFQKLKFKP